MTVYCISFKNFLNVVNVVIAIINILLNLVVQRNHDGCIVRKLFYL